MRLHSLPNSTSLVETPTGSILINCPPETLKYLLAQKLPIPQIVLLPPDMPTGRELGSSGFVRQGVNFASVEFILYANFFVQNRRTRIITATAVQARRLQRILSETLLGPTDPQEYRDLPELQRECAAVGLYPPLGRPPTPDDLADILAIEHETLELGDGVTARLNNDRWVLQSPGESAIWVSTRVFDAPRPLTLAPPRPLQRHELTLQFIGGSDGFDPVGITTCFLAYLGSESVPILFDTAAYIRLRLGNLGIAPPQLAAVFLSHLHEDHLAGLPELLLMGGARLRVITSDLIYRSLLRVLSAMLALPEKDVATLFDHLSLNPGNPINLNNHQFETIYAVHSIPTLAVRVSGLCFSGDMRYDENWFDELVAQGILTPQRRQRLLHFAEGAKILVQDAGGGQIHTTITPQVLQSLAAKSQRVILAHTSKTALPDPQWQGQVEFASSGYVSAIGEALSAPPEQQEILQSLAACPLFARLSIEERLALLPQLNLRAFADGEYLIRDAQPSNGEIYIMHSGLAEIITESQRRMIIGRGGSFGEYAALTGSLRHGDIRAHGSVQVLCLPQQGVTHLDNRLHLRAAFTRVDWLLQHPLFDDLLWAHLFDLALDFVPRALNPGEILFQHSEPGYETYLLVEGAVEIIAPDGRSLATLDRPGEFFGGRAPLTNSIRSASARALTTAEVWSLSPAALRRLQAVYPHILLHLRAVESTRD